MIKAIALKLLRLRAADAAVPKLRSRKRFTIGVLLLTLFLALRPGPSSAACCGADTCVPTCDGATTACCVIDAASVLGTLFAAFTAYLNIVVKPAIVDAVSSSKSANVSANSTQTSVQVETAKVVAAQGMFFDHAAAMAKVNTTTIYNTSSVQCRLSTVTQTAKLADPFARQLVDSAHRSSINLAMNPAYTKGRVRAAAGQRYCKNGMLPKTVIGNSAFTKLGCFEDPPYTSAFALPGTIKDHLVVVPPPSKVLGTYPDGKPITAMSILDNPDDPANPQPAQVVWDSLTDKQKWYVAMMRYCQHQEQSVMIPNRFTGDQASAPEGMEQITKNFGAQGRLQTLMSACYTEVARRTAVNVYDTDDPAMATPSIQKKLRNDPRVANQLARKGMSPKIWQAYTSYNAALQEPDGAPVLGPDGNPQVFISPALYQYAKYTNYCSDQDTFNSMNLNSGNDNARYDSQVGGCEQVRGKGAELAKKHEAFFDKAMTEVQSMKSGFTGNDVPAPAKAEYAPEGTLRRVNMQDDAQDPAEIVPLITQLKAIDEAGKRSARVAR